MKVQSSSYSTKMRQQFSGSAVLVLSSAFLGTIGILLGLFHWSGIPTTTSIRLALLISLNIFAFGSIWALWRGTSIGLSEFAGSGIIGSLFVSLAITLLAPQSLVVPAQWVLLPVLAILLMVINTLRGGKTFGVRFDFFPLLAGLSAAFSALFLNRFNFQRYQLNSQVDFSTYHPDLFFHQALTNSIMENGIATHGLMSGWTIRYHWFSHAMAAALEVASGSGPFIILTRVLPIMAIFAMALMVSSWANSLIHSRWLPLAAAATVTTGKFVGDSSGVQINWDSPSQTVSTAFLIFSGFVFYKIYCQEAEKSFIAVVIASAFALAGLKFSSSIVLFAGIASVTAYLAVTRSPERKVAVHTLIGSLLAILFVYFIWLNGQSDTGGLTFRTSDFENFNLITDPAFAVTLALLPGWLGLAFLAARNPQNWWSPTPLSLGVAMGGLVPLWVLTIGGPNSLWFLTSATSVVWIISVAGAWKLTNQSKPTSKRKVNPLFASSIGLALLSVLTWGFIQVQFELPQGVTQLVFMGTLIVIGFLIAIAISSFIKLSLALTTISLIVMAGALTPIATNFSNFFFPKTLELFTQTPTPTDTSVTQADVSLIENSLTPQETNEAIFEFQDLIVAGEILATTSDSLLPIAVVERSQLYAADEITATGLGPLGSQEEFDHRRELIEALIEEDSQAALTIICSDNVAWLLSINGGSQPVTVPKWADFQVSTEATVLTRLNCRDNA